MNETNAAATLSIAITTGDAATQLETLATKYEALKQSFAKGAGTSGFSKEATAEIQKLKTALASVEATYNEKMRKIEAQLERGAQSGKKIAASYSYAFSGFSSGLDVALKKGKAGVAEFESTLKGLAKTTKELAFQQAPFSFKIDRNYAGEVTAQARKAFEASVQYDRAWTEAHAVEAKKRAAASAAAETALARARELALTQQRVASATTTSTNAQQKWNAMAGEGHALARGLSGSLGTLWITYGQLAPLMAGAALGAGFKAAAQAGAELAYQLTFVKALGDESAGAVAVLTARTLELSKSSLYGPTEIASGFRVLAQAGLNANDALKAMPQTLDLATVGEMNMEQAAVTLVGVMNAFGLSVDKASHVGDVFAKAAAVSQTSVQAMTQSMRTASVVGEMYGASMEDTATAITLLAKVNITGTAAGTSFRNMLKELYTPTAGAATVMKNLGVVTKDASGQLRPFADVIYDLQGKLKDFNKADQTTILQKIFGERGAKEAISMLALTRAEWDELNKSISDSSGFMRKVGAELEGTVKGRWIQAINTLKANLTSAFGDMEGTFGAIADNLKSTFDDPAFIASLKTLVSGMSTLFATLVQAGPTLVKFAEAWVAVKVGMVAASMWTATAAGITGVTGALRTAQAATTAYSVGLGVAVGAANTAAASTSVLSTAVGTLPARFALLANPITATVAVLATLGTAFYLFRDRTAESMEQSAKHIADFSKDAIKSLEEVLAKVDQSNVAVQSAVVKANEAVISNNIKTMTSQLDVLKRQFGFADAKSATDYVAQVDRDYAGNTLAHDDARRDRKSDKYKAAKAYNDILQETIKLQGVYGEAVQKTEELETKRWAAKVESAIIDQNRAKKDLSGVLGGDSKTPNGASDVVAQINKDYEGRIKAIQDGAKAEETALRRAYQQSEISEVELIEGVAAAKAKAHVEALESYNEQIAKAEKAGAKGSQLTDLKNKQAEEVRAITQVWDDATADVAEVKRKFAETLLSWEAKAFAKDNTTAMDEAQANITKMMADFSKGVKEFPEAETIRIANIIKAFYNDALMKDAKAEIQSNFNALTTSLTDLGSQVDAMESDMERDGGWISRIFNTQQINELIATTLPQLEAELIRLKALMAAAPEGSDEQGEFAKQLARVQEQYDKFAHYVPKVWKDVVNNIDSTFHDGFVAMMKDGKTSWKEFTKSLKDMFKTTVADAIYQMLARPLVMNVVASVGGTLGITGLANAASSDGSTSSGLSSYMNLGSNAYSAYTGQSLLGGMYSDFALSSLGTSLGLSTGLSSALGVASGAGSVMGSGAALAAAEATQAGATALTSFGSTLGAALPYIGLAAGAISLLAGSFGKGGTPHAGGIVYSDGTTTSYPRTRSDIQSQYADPEDYHWQIESDWTKRFSQSVADAITPTATSIASTLNSASDVFGNGKDYKVGLAFSSDGETKSRGRYSIVDSAGEEVFDWGRRKFSKDAEEGMGQFISATGEGIVAVLKQMDLPSWASGLLDSLGSTDIEAVSALVQQMNAIQTAAEKLSPALEMTENDFAAIYLKAGDAAMTAYYSLVTSSSEQLADSYRLVSDAFDDAGAVMPDSIDGFRKLIAGIDETTAEGKETIATLFQLSSAFGTVQAAIDNLRSGVADATFSLRDSGDQQIILAQRLADAAAEAGVSVPRTADELLAMADSIDYTTQAGMQLATVMPALASAFVAVRDAAAAAAESAAVATAERLETQASRIDAYLQAQQAAQKEAQTALLNEQKSSYSDIVASAKSIASTFEGIVDSLQEYRRSILQSEKSSLSPEQQYAEAKRQFELTAAKARLGDVDAANNLQSVVGEFLDASREISVTSADYAVDFGKSIAALDGVIGTASNQAGIANQQLAVAQAQLDALNSISSSLNSSASPATPVVDDLPLVVKDFTQAMLDWEAWFANTAIGQTQSFDVGSTTRISNDKGIFTDLAGNSYVFSQSSGPYGLADQSAAWAKEMLKRYGQWKVPSYDVGTNFVPKDMLAMVHQGEAIVPRQFNPALHNTSSDNAELIAEVQALRSELKIALSTVANNTAKTAKTLDRVMPEGDALSVRIAA